MTVRLAQGRIMLEGRCPADDADILLQAILDGPRAPVDVAGVRKLHMAVLQILLSCKPAITGTPATPFLSRNIFNSLISNKDRPDDFS